MEESAVYYYDSGTNFEFPLDSSLKKLEAKTKYSRKLIRNSISALDVGREPDSNRSFEREIITGRHTKYNKRATALLRWEILPLIESLISVRSFSSSYNGNRLAEAALQDLARVLVDSPSDSPLDYRDLVALQSEAVQRMMVLRFKKEIELRCEALIFLACKQKPRVAASNTLEVCRLVDELIARLDWDCPTEGDKAVGVDDFTEVFDNLLKVREHSIVSADRSESNAVSRLKFTHSDPAVVNALKGSLRRGHKDIERAYNAYLCAHLDKTKADAATKLATDLRKHGEYVFGDPEDEEGFRYRVSEELIKYTAEQFRALLHLNQIDGYTYSRIDAPSLADAYVAGSLEKCHEQIMFRLHTPFYLLRAYYTIKHFNIKRNDDNKDKLDQLRGNIKSVIQRLSENEEYEPIRVPSSNNAKDYMQYYEKNAKLEIRNADDDGKPIVTAFDFSKSDVMDDIDCVANLLLMYCAVIASNCIDRCVDEVVNNQHRVLSFRSYAKAQLNYPGLA